MHDRTELPAAGTEPLTWAETEAIIRNAEALRAETLANGLAAAFRWLAALPGQIFAGGKRRHA